jgi:hypothetical protein
MQRERLGTEATKNPAVMRGLMGFQVFLGIPEIVYWLPETDSNRRPSD